MEIASRRIVLVNATTSPGLEWVKQQIRQATAWAQRPRFLLHDNDGIFGQFRDRKRRGERQRSHRCHLDVWLADVMGIEGIPIPYGAPNASPHIERFNRTLREEALVRSSPAQLAKASDALLARARARPEPSSAHDAPPSRRCCLAPAA